MNPLALKPRTAFILSALLCASLLGYAYYSQFVTNLEPCPLCILQRVGYIGLFAVSVIAAIHNPAPKARRVYGVLAMLAIALGIGTAGRHVWIQHLPPDQVPACGPGLFYMMDTLPIATALKKAFIGTGECAKVDWTFLGLSMPEWNLGIYVVLFFAAYWYGFRRYGD